MLGLIQRVSRADVVINGSIHGAIDKGLLLFLGIEKSDTPALGTKLLAKILNYRVFGDELNHMNLSLLDTQGELLIVSQFTLAADTRKGLRPSFSAAAPPEMAEPLYEQFVANASSMITVATGQFGADMQVSLVNDGPVTFLLSVNQ
jgi:D-tyrosyl-tRNA(Tyr) deacylase